MRRTRGHRVETFPVFGGGIQGQSHLGLGGIYAEVGVVIDDHPHTISSGDRRKFGGFGAGGIRDGEQDGRGGIRTSDFPLASNPRGQEAGISINNWLVRIGTAARDPGRNCRIVVARYYVGTVSGEDTRISIVVHSKSVGDAHFQHTARKCRGTLFLVKTTCRIGTNPKHAVRVGADIVNGGCASIRAVVVTIEVVVAERLAVFDGQITFQREPFCRRQDAVVGEGFGDRTVVVNEITTILSKAEREARTRSSCNRCRSRARCTVGVTRDASRGTDHPEDIRRRSRASTIRGGGVVE